MADWPRQGGDSRWDSSLPSGNDYGDTIQSSASTNTKGTWNELIASLPFDTAGFVFQTCNNGAAHLGLSDIGIGASTAEIVLVADIAVAPVRAGTNMWAAYMPLALPRGTRISARHQAASASQTVVAAVLPVAASGDSVGLSRVVSYGQVPASSTLTNVDPGGTANTKGAWTEMTAASEFDIRQLIINMHSFANATMTAANYRIDIGVGANPNEVAIISDILQRAETNNDQFEQKVYGPLPVNIPKGSRIVARSQCTTTDATDRRVGLQLIGFG